MKGALIVVGVLGNILSGGVFLAPVLTFREIRRRGSAEGFSAVPYTVALFSGLLWLYFAITTSDVLLITINVFGSVMEVIYVLLFVYYSAFQARIRVAVQIAAISLCLLVIVLATHLGLSGDVRAVTIGWIASGIAICTFAAPLVVVVQAVKAQSTEFFSLPLSLLLMFSAVAWFAYGMLKHDWSIALPNILGFLFAVVQVALFIGLKIHDMPRLFV